MAEENGCVRVVVALLSALFWTIIILFGMRFLMDGAVGPFLQSRGMSYPMNTGAYVSFYSALIVFVWSFWAFVRVKKEPEPRPIPAPPPEPVKYIYICDDCKKVVDRDARVCPFCQGRFSGEHRANHKRQKYEKVTQPRS